MEYYWTIIKNKQLKSQQSAILDESQNLWWVNDKTKRDYVLYNSIFIKVQKIQTNLQWVKINWCLPEDVDGKTD